MPVPKGCTVSDRDAACLAGTVVALTCAAALYDAQRTDLALVVEETIQPFHGSLWLRCGR
jgi:3-hydroxy-3-methylglutaryl CoA synthase